MAMPDSGEIPKNDLTQNKLDEALFRPWYRRWWTYAALGFLLFWFGVPPLLRLVSPPPPSGLNEPAGGFTAAPGTSSGSSTSQVDVVTTDDPSLGVSTAPITIVEFGDFQCPYCREAAPIMRQVLAKYPEAVRLIYRDFPLVDIHDQAVAAAEAANCAEQQGQFWPYHDQLYQNQDRLGEELYLELAREFGLDLTRFARCREGHLTLADIQTDYEAGVVVGVHGTPTWFVNGYKLEGALTFEAWARVIPEVLKLTLAKPKP